MWNSNFLLLSMAGSGLMIVLLGFISEPLLTLPVIAMFGFLLPLIKVNIISLMQGTTPSEVRGRVMGVMGTLVLGLFAVFVARNGVPGSPTAALNPGAAGKRTTLSISRVSRHRVGLSRRLSVFLMAD